MQAIRRSLLCLAAVTSLVIALVHAHQGDHQHDDYTHPAMEQVESSAIKPWTDKPFFDDPDDFHFAIVSDRTGAHRPGVFPMALDKLNLIMPEFVISVGDLIEGYYADPALIDAEWEEFVGFIESLEMPFFYLPGNHDIWSPLSKRKWKERFGVTYYHHLYKDVLFLHLNTLDGGRVTLSPAQVEYFKQALTDNPDPRWTFVLMHEPLWMYKETPDGNPTGWLEIEKALRERDYTVFAGHWHYYRQFERHKQNYYILATTGGGSGLEGAKYGGFDHVVWVTMTDQGPRLANLELDGIHAADVSTEESFSIYNPLIGAPQLAAEPIYIDSQGTLLSNATHIRIQNKAYLPMEIEGHILAGEGVSIQPASFKLGVEPDQSASLPVAIEQSVPIEHARQLPIRYTVTYRPAGRVPSELSYERALHLAAKHDLPLVEAFHADGSLDEWEALPYAVTNLDHFRGRDWEWTGPADASFRFAAAQDRQGNLLLAALVQDDHLVADPATIGTEDFRMYHSDSISFFIDARPDPQRSLNEADPQTAFSEFLPIRLLAPGSFQDASWDFAIERANELPQGIEATFLPTGEGYAAEILVPAAILDNYQGGPWQDVRLQVSYHDRDDAISYGLNLFWQPPWQRRYAEATNLPASGTFTR